MKASDKTIEFCKAWIEGKLTKSQHMHYYIVKTPHAEFMMKRNDGPDLVAIKDSFGHIFIPDDSVDKYSLEDRNANPFFAIIKAGGVFAYSFLAESPINYMENLSKWQTLDHKAIPHTTGLNINLALIKIGEKFYTTEIRPNNSNLFLSLLDWANFMDVQKTDLKNLPKNRMQPYTILTEAQGKPAKLDDCRMAYVDFAGDMKEHSKISSKWVIIPSDKVNLPDILNKNIYEVLKTRPIPYSYGVPNRIIHYERAMERLHYPFTTAQLETPNAFIELPDVRSFIYSGDLWRNWLMDTLDSELAMNMIRFIDDDDAWLQNNTHIIAPFVLGNKYFQLYKTWLTGYALLVEEANPSVLPTHVLYLKGTIRTGEYDINGEKKQDKYPTFTKFIPAPHTEDKEYIERFIEWM